MKPFLAILTGFVASLGMFAVGLAFAGRLIYVDAVRQPAPGVDVADLWTAEPRKVDRARQHLERVPALVVDRSASSGTKPADETRVAASAATPAIAPAPVDAAPVDTVTTASVQETAGEGAREDRLPFAESGEQPTPSDQLSISHMEWCAIRYRSYRPEDNSYTSYDGGQQPCVSPYTRDPARQEAASTLGAAPVVRAYPDADSYAGDPAFPEEASVQYAADDSGYAGSDHASYCFSHYRSYRPEDNSYQPFGGGARRQCE